MTFWDTLMMCCPFQYLIGFSVCSVSMMSSVLMAVMLLCLGVCVCPCACVSVRVCAEQAPPVHYVRVV